MPPAEAAAVGNLPIRIVVNSPTEADAVWQVLSEQWLLPSFDVFLAGGDEVDDVLTFRFRRTDDGTDLAVMPLDLPPDSLLLTLADD